MARSLAWDLSRLALKQFMGGSDRLHAYLGVTGMDVCEVKDDFTGPVIDAGKWTVGNGAGASAASPAISVGVVNGIITMVTGTAGDNTASSTLAGGRHFRGDQNPVLIARVAISAVVTSVKVEIGFRDAITTTAGAHFVVDVKATPTFISTDGAVWVLDTADNEFWEGVAVANGTAATTVEAAISPTAAAYEYLQVALVDGLAY